MTWLLYFNDDDIDDSYNRKQECIRSKYDTEWTIYLNNLVTDAYFHFKVTATASEIMSLYTACYAGMYRLYQYSSADTLKDRIREYANSCPDRYDLYNDLEWYFRLDDGDDMFEDCSHVDEFIDIILENFDELYEKRTR